MSIGTPPAKRRARGDESEALARAYLEARGYRVIETNYRTKRGEVDIIAWHDDTLCFIEVRSVETERYGSALATITRQKQRRVITAARHYLMTSGITDVPMRFDALGITRVPLTYSLVPHAFQTDG